MTKRYVVMFLLAIILVHNIAYASEEIINESDVKEAILKDSFLSNGGLGFVELNSKRLLVSIASIPIDNKLPRTIINARRIAKLRSEAAFSKFISGERVSAEETLTSKSVAESDGHKQSVHYQDVLIEIQRSYTKMQMPPVDAIEGWMLDNPASILHVIYSVVPPN